MKKEQFEKDYYELTTKKMCEKYDISEGTMQTYRKKFGIEPKKRGRQPKFKIEE